MKLLSRCPLALMCVLFHGIDSFIYGYEFHNASLISVWFRFIFFHLSVFSFPYTLIQSQCGMASKQWYLDGSQYSVLFALFRTFGLLYIAQNTRTRPVLRLYICSNKNTNTKTLLFFFSFLSSLLSLFLSASLSFILHVSLSLDMQSNGVLYSLLDCIYSVQVRSFCVFSNILMCKCVQSTIFNTHIWNDRETFDMISLRFTVDIFEEIRRCCCFFLDFRWLFTKTQQWSHYSVL